MNLMSKIKHSFIAATCLLLIQGSMVYAQNNVVPALPPDGVAPTTINDYNNLIANDTYALPWGPIKESNILWRKRAWRDIDIQQPGNEFFANNDCLAKIMLAGFFEGKYKLYSGANDRFTIQLDKADIMSLLTPGNKNDSLIFKPNEVTRYRIKEDWLFLKQEHRLVVRIAGIAPLAHSTQPDGTITDQPAFWVYHPETRYYFASYKVVGKETEPQNWDQLFEGRKFASTITKASGWPDPHMPPVK
jgi:hypothetical protein